jgi:hypothetical protein
MNNDFSGLCDSLTSLGFNDSLSSNSDLHSQIGNSNDQDHLLHSGMSDFNLQYGAESCQFSGFETTGFDNHPQDYSLPDSTNLHHPQPDYHQNIGYGDSSLHNDYGYDLGSIGHHDHHSFSATSQLQVMNCHDNCPYTTISNDGSNL